MRFFYLLISFGALVLFFQNCTSKTPGSNSSVSPSKQANILLIILDDIGVGEFYGYSHGASKPNMVNIKSLVDQGVIFDQAWAYPVCSPTRVSISTGKYPFRTGVTDAVDNSVLDTSEKILHQYINEETDYAIAHYGKWHISGNDHSAPSTFGVDEFRGLISGSVSDYYSWPFSENGSVSTSTEYVTKKLTDLSINFISTQKDKPWFLWLAYNSPHTPFHIPPSGTFTQTGLVDDQTTIDTTPRPYFNAMVENIDFEIGRLLNSLPSSVREKTTVILLGDNGSHKKIVQAPYQQYQAKGGLFQGGIHVPMLVSGYGVNRSGEREAGLVSSVDIFATILDLVGVSLADTHDSISFKSSLSVAGTSRSTNFSQITSDGDLSKTGEAIRNEQYKFITYDSGIERFFDLTNDPYEQNSLINSLDSAQQLAYDFLKNQLTELLSTGPYVIPTIVTAESDFDSSILSYNIVDTNQAYCYDSLSGDITTSCTHYDANYVGNQPNYTVSSDGLTVRDNITELTWTQSTDTNGDNVVDYSDKLSQSDSIAYCNNLTLGGFLDWRLPDIKTQYSLILFSGKDASNYTRTDTSLLAPFIDSKFDWAFGDLSAGDRIIDGQYASATSYVSTTMNADATTFGVNFVDGRIKGYPTARKNFYVRCVRGNTNYGINNFKDNGNYTISDLATGLMWKKNDDPSTDFDNAILSCQSDTTGGHTDWRLPDIKELQSILDYSRSPDTNSNAAVDPVFNSTSFTNEEGVTEWGYYWSSTTHVDNDGDGKSGSYISFGRALGYFMSQILDVHGAGAQRSNYKQTLSGMPGVSLIAGSYGDYYIKGPQGDILRINNKIRCVRNF